MSTQRVTIEQLRAERETYFTGCLKIRTKSSKLEPFVMKPEQRRLAAVIEHERRNGRAPRIIVLKSRQVGISTFSQAELFWNVHMNPLVQALVLAHKIESAEYLFNMSRRFYSQLPEGLRSKTKHETKRMLHFEDNDSALQVEVAGQVRGYTAQLLHLSELAFWASQQDTYTAVMQTVPDDTHSLVIIESTPNGVGDLFHTLWVEAEQGRNGFVPFFSPWFEEPTYTKPAWFGVDDLSEREMAMLKAHDLTLDQIAWYRFTLSNKCGGDQDKMDQEYGTDPHSCFLASGRKVFDTDGIRHYSMMVPPHVPEESLPAPVEIEPGAKPRTPLLIPTRGGRLIVFRPPEARHLHVVGADIGEGDRGSDPSGLVDLNRHTLNLDAVWHGRTPPEVLAHYAVRMCWLYNEALLIWEANQHGILFGHVIEQLGYTNIYFRRTSEESVARRVTDKPGYYTSKLTRGHIFNCAREYVRNRSGLIQHPALVREMSEAYYDEKNQVQHPAGGTTDLLVGLGLAIIGHKGSHDGTLEPLPMEKIRDAIYALRERRARASMGQLTDRDTDHISGMTVDELEELDQIEEQRARARARVGLGGMR